MWGNVMRGLQSLQRQRERGRVGRQCRWVSGHPFVLTQSQLNRWVPPERSGTEGERRSVSGLKGHMTQGRTTQRTGVNPQSNIHYILGYPPIFFPTPQIHNYLKDGLTSTLLPSPRSVSRIPIHPWLESLSHPALGRCGWPPLGWSVRGCSFVPCKGLLYVFGSFEGGQGREEKFWETVRGWEKHLKVRSHQCSNCELKLKIAFIN